LPGCGFNEYFIQAWRAWDRGDYEAADSALKTVQPLVDAVSGKGHEFSLHARKYLLHRAGIIAHPYVRRPTVPIKGSDLARVDVVADMLRLKITRT
jgi:dihydrodipicolinate synthase/N-acetylneuraminate lyase